MGYNNNYSLMFYLDLGGLMINNGYIFCNDNKRFFINTS